MNKQIDVWVDQEWAEQFVKQEKELSGTPTQLDNGEANEDYYNLLENLHEQWMEMNQDTKNLIWQLRSQGE